MSVLHAERQLGHLGCSEGVLWDGTEVPADLRPSAGPELFPLLGINDDSYRCDVGPHTGWGEIPVTSSGGGEKATEPPSPKRRSPARPLPAALCEGSRFGKQLFTDILEKFYSLKSLASQRKWNFSWANIKRCQNWRSGSIHTGHLIRLCRRSLGVAGWSEESAGTTGNIFVLSWLCFLFCQICKVSCAAVLQPQQRTQGNPHSTACCTSPERLSSVMTNAHPLREVHWRNGRAVHDFHWFIYVRRYNFWPINIYFNFQFLKEMLFAPRPCLGEHLPVVEHNAFFRMLSTQDHLRVRVV